VIGHPCESLPAVATSAATFLTLTVIERNKVSFAGVPVQEKLEQMSFELAARLTGQRDPGVPMLQAVGYSIREAIRNVFEHAATDEAIIMAQRWADGRAEIAIGDAGVGIYDSLSCAYKLRDEAHALRMAVLPGISDYTGPETRDRWQNSGFGLYMLSEVGKTFGRLELGSSGQLLSVGPKGTTATSTGAKNVTVLGVGMQVADDYYFNNFLDRTREKGEALAKNIPGARVQASASSSGMWK